MAVPADLARKHAITIDHTKVGTGGVSDFSFMVQRDHLDDEVVDPSGGNAARTDGGGGGIAIPVVVHHRRLMGAA